MDNYTKDLVNTMRSYTVAEVSEITGISATSIRRSIREGYLNAFVLRGCERGYRIMRSDMEAWIDGMRRETAS